MSLSMHSNYYNHGIVLHTTFDSTLILVTDKIISHIQSNLFFKNYLSRWCLTTKNKIPKGHPATTDGAQSNDTA